MTASQIQSAQPFKRRRRPAPTLKVNAVPGRRFRWLEKMLGLPDIDGQDAGAEFSRDMMDELVTSKTDEDRKATPQSQSRDRSSAG